MFGKITMTLATGKVFDSCGSDKNTTHSYGPVYDRILEGMVGRVKRVLEIGVDKGYSLKAWRRIFPDVGTEIVGFDIGIVEGGSEAENIWLIQGDQRLVSDLGRLVEGRKYDIVIDDGSHKLEDQLVSWIVLWDHVNPGGYYVIEDIQRAEDMDVFRKLGAEVLDLRPVKGRYDDIMVIFRKGEDGCDIVIGG